VQHWLITHLPVFVVKKFIVYNHLAIYRHAMKMKEEKKD